MFFKLLLITLLIFAPIFVECSPLILTKYIKEKRLSEGKDKSEVKGLPNAPKINSYSGFFTVDHKYNSNLFFWFFPSAKNPVKAPIVVWLEGGPGASSVWTLFTLNGPFRVDKHLNVSLNPNTLTDEFSVLYVDNPVGTGYSFTDDEKGYSTNENSVADNLYEFLKQFYQIFSEYRDNELYISGESYAGKYVPALGYKLMQMSKESKMNFRGVAVGNGLIDPVGQLDGFVYLKSTGLIDEIEQDQLNQIAARIKQLYKQKKFLEAADMLNKLCILSKLTGYGPFHNFLRMENSAEMYFQDYLELNKTRDAIHVGDVKNWMFSQKVFQMLSTDIIIPMFDNLTALIPHYKVMLFDGNLDMLDGPAQHAAMLENKDWKYYNEFYHAKRVIWKVSKNDTEVAGYSKGFGNFSYVIIRNAPHAVATEKPICYLDMMKRFIRNLSFE